MEPDKYGPFAEPVALVVALFTALGAIGFAWKGRAKWEPVEDDVPALMTKVGGVANAFGLVFLWFFCREAPGADYAAGIALLGTLVLICAASAYYYLVSARVFDQRYSPAKNREAARKIIGGFKLTPKAQERYDKGESEQKLLEGSGNEPDRVWERSSRAGAKVLFQLVYLAIIVSGSWTAVALIRLVANAKP